MKFANSCRENLRGQSDLGFFFVGNFWSTRRGSHFAIFAFSYLQIPNFAVLKVGWDTTSFSVFMVLNNTRNVFSEYHNVPMNTRKVFIALSTVGFLRKPICTFTTERSLRELSLCK